MVTPPVRPQSEAAKQPAPVVTPAPAVVVPKAAPKGPARAIESAAAHEARGRELTNQGALQQAIAELTEAIRLKPGAATALNARGYAYLRSRDYAHAVADFTEAIRLNPNYGNAYRNRAAARRLMGDAAGAEADLAKAREFTTQ